MSRRILPVLPLLALLAACGSNDEKTLRLSGIMEATTVRVSAQTPGIVTSLLFEEGTPVKAGQTLLTEETERLGHQLDQSTATQEEIAHQSAALDAQLRAATASRDNIRTRFDRFSALLATHATTQQSVDDLRTQLDAAEEQIRTLRAQISGLESRRRQITAGAAVLRTQQRDATITSPIDGRVLVRYTEQGELLGTGSPVCDIADLGTLWTKIYLEEKRLPDVKLGSVVTIRIDGTPNRTMQGIVTWISDKAEFTPKTILTEETRTSLVYPAKVLVRNPDGLLKIGMPVTVVVPIGSASNGSK